MTGRRIPFGEGTDRAAAVAQAAEAFRRDGVVVLDDLVDPAKLEGARAEIERDHPGYDRPDPTRNYGLHPGRFTMPLPVAGTLADRAVFCPHTVLAIVERLLGQAFALDSVGLLVSLPGVPDQDRHSDALLFPETPIDRLLPPVAIAFSLPLVRMDEVSGTTAFWTGSHLDPRRIDGPQDFAPVVPLGSALLWDYRVHHRGLANRGDHPRPVLFSVFCRDWWAEVPQIGATGYEKLAIARPVHDALGDRMRRVVRRARVAD